VPTSPPRHPTMPAPRPPKSAEPDIWFLWRPGKMAAVKLSIARYCRR
jgi:hypothetical protein